jgi:HlyD family secretion protein
MRNKALFVVAFIGILAGLVSAYVHGIEKKPLPPLFNPATDPFKKGIYVNGIVESHQANGQNVNLYPDVSGPVVEILVSEGQIVQKGAPLLKIEDSVQRATVEQQKSQAEAALAVLEELKAQPRKENLEVFRAQVDLAEANLKTVRDQLDKQTKSYELDPNSISKDALDNAVNAKKAAEANLGVARRQFELTKAGAWDYDVRNQEKLYAALSSARNASAALLYKYTINAPADGVILSINTAVGSYVSPQGAYQSYTQGFGPALVMGSAESYQGVRCYVDEILINRLPASDKIHAQMTIRGTNTNIPLEFVRIQPYVSPKIALSDQRNERVDLRVLPLIFKFLPPKNAAVYPGQLVDVYIEEK